MASLASQRLIMHYGGGQASEEQAATTLISTAGERPEAATTSSSGRPVGRPASLARLPRVHSAPALLVMCRTQRTTVPSRYRINSHGTSGFAQLISEKTDESVINDEVAARTLQEIGLLGKDVEEIGTEAFA